jgi:hypothetical protein
LNSGDNLAVGGIDGINGGGTLYELIVNEETSLDYLIKDKGLKKHIMMIAFEDKLTLNRETLGSGSFNDERHFLKKNQLI